MFVSLELSGNIKKYPIKTQRTQKNTTSTKLLFLLFVSLWEILNTKTKRSFQQPMNNNLQTKQ